MAAPNTTYVQALVHSLQNYVRGGKFADNIYGDNKILQMLLKKDGKVREDGGTELVVQLEYAVNDTGAWIGDYGPYDTRPQDTFTGANFQWKQLAITVILTTKEQLQNTGATRVANLFKNKMQNAEKQMRRLMNQAIWNDGTNSLAPIGLQAIVSTSGTLGGIDRTSQTWWRANEDTTTESLGIPKMETMYNNCSIDNEEPQFIATTQTLYEKYGALAQSFQEIQRPQASTADVSFEHYSFKGKPLFFDRDCPSTHMYFLNANGFKIHCHKDWEFRVMETQKVPNQPVWVTPIQWAGNILPHEPRLLGRLTNKS